MPVKPIRQGLSRLSNTGSGEPTSCALVVATNELLRITDLRELTCRLQGQSFEWDGLIFCTLDVVVFFFLGVALVYKLQLIGVNFLHDCMEELNVNL